LASAEEVKKVSTMDEVEESDWDKVIALTSMGTILCVQAAERIMKGA